MKLIPASIVLERVPDRARDRINKIDG